MRWDKPLIEQGRLTLSGMLKTEGYNTACFGKWHLGWNWPFTSNEEVPIGDAAKLRKHASRGIDFSKPVTGGPLDHGFDHYFGDDVINFEPYVLVPGNN